MGVCVWSGRQPANVADVGSPAAVAVGGVVPPYHRSPWPPSGHHPPALFPKHTCVVLGGEIRRSDSCAAVIFHSIILLPAPTPSPQSIF